MAATLKRVAIKFAGESGQGVNSIGEIIAKASKRSGFKVFAYREYPSLIKGGHAAYQIDISDQEINSSASAVDLLVCISREAIHAYLETVRQEGMLVHSIEKVAFTNQEQKWISDHKINVVHIDAFATARSFGGNYFTLNMVMMGYIAALLDIRQEKVTEIINTEFADKKDLLDTDLKCIEGGYKLVNEKLGAVNLPTLFKADPEWENSLVLSGNQAIGTGAIAAGVRAVYGYPMTPASSILSFLAEQAHRTGMVVKQAEDEITAAQMTLGSMFMGTRAMTATSGGGFDLMTESVSLAGMTETPFVCVLAQRPGPATGIPTWTAAGDLNLAIYAGHGEFPRIVLAASDAESAYRLTQAAFNYAETYQTVVILLTEKQIAESLFNVKEFSQPTKLERNIVTSVSKVGAEKLSRYAITDSGISPRWLPGSFDTTYVANSDEHLEDGTLTEDAEPAKKMMDKRMRKLKTILHDLPEPELFGPTSGQTLLVGWGSVKGAVRDALSLRERPESSQVTKKLDNLKKTQKVISYLHYEYLFPLNTTKLVKLAESFEHVVLVENNYIGQLGQLIEQQTDIKFSDKLLKYDGRPFFVDDIVSFLEKPQSNKSQVLFGIMGK